MIIIKTRETLSFLYKRDYNNGGGDIMQIYYQVIGEGFPIVCLHGNGENHHIFDDMVKKLSSSYQLILIDSRYHGQSIHQGELSYQQMMKDVVSIVDELQLRAYDVIGFSDGGIIALLLAMNDSRVQHIITMGANTQPNMIKTIYRMSMVLRMFCLIPFFYRQKARLDWKLSMLMMKEPHIDYINLKNIKVPVLVLAGEFDMIKEIDTRNIGNALPYSVVKIIKGGNHFLLRDSFQQTMKEIILFLEACHQEDKNE